MVPARCFQLPAIIELHSVLSSAPIVNHFFIGTGICSLSRDFNLFTGTPNPMAPPDLMASIDTT